MPAMEKVEPAVMQTTIPANQSKYLDYSPELVAGLAGQPHALFFHASWCPSCRSLDSDIAESLADLGGTVVKVDYDSSVDLRKKYSVTSQHTLVFFDANGAVASTKLGGNLKDIRSFFAN